MSEWCAAYLTQCCTFSSICFPSEAANHTTTRTTATTAAIWLSLSFSLSLSYFLFSESAVSLCIILYFLLLRFYFLVIRHRCWCIVSYSSSVFVLSRPHYFCDEFSFAAVVVDVILGRYMCLWTLFISEVLLLLLL